ncbi:MAG: tetratricopeptide repeat protein [Caldilineaceae bacterium]|nr:tetratricopeptide repeat protein [Caldilineaceae bacterium]MBP8108686.1 tetratricopeptide repeat protein [Caldilineaceae bacterium]MBP9072087.1 tetratricopeptide repeat protein [Caldilineaceae bacterium]
MTSSTSFGIVLRQMRKRACMTQGDLAAAVGYSPSFISSLEKEIRQPDVATIAQYFVPALGLQDEPHLAARLVELAAAARGESPPVATTSARRSHITQNDAEQSSLPTPPTPLLGREDEVRTLSNRLLGHSGRLMTLLGPPGIGKSRLALEIATRLHSAYRNGALFVPLAPLDDPSLFPTTLARALHLSLETTQPAIPRLIGHLRRKEMLLVLDNFEQIILAGAVVADLLAECPGLRVLVTSQERLHLRGEQQVRVAPLGAEAASALFVQCAQAADEGFALTDHNRPTIAAICGRLDCLPLAIELSASRMDQLSPQQLLARLTEKHLDLGNPGPQDLPPHQRTLAAAIQRSYRLLSAQEQRLFRGLAVFVGDFDAVTVTELGLDPIWLESLATRSLIQLERRGDARCYRLLETLRTFASDQLILTGENGRLRHDHAAWMLRLARQADKAMRSAERPNWLARLDNGIDNLRAALGWAVQFEPETALALAGVLQEFWYSRGYNDEGREWLRRSLAAAPGATADRVRALNALGQLLGQQSDYAEAQRQLDQAETLARSLNDPAGLAETLRLAAWAANDRHDQAKAIALFHEALPLFRSLGDRVHTADTLTSLAHFGMMTPETDRGQIQQWLQESLVAFREVGDLPGPIFALHQKGLLAVADGAYDAAARHYDEALTLARALGQKPEIAWGLGLLGEAYWLRGDLESALACWQEAHHHFLALGSREAVAITQHHLGQVARRQGNLDQATALYTESLAAHQAAGDQDMIARCLAGLGAVALARGDKTEAAHLLGAAKILFDRLPPFLSPADAAEFRQLLAALC